jgi:hypothetical protein
VISKQNGVEFYFEYVVKILFFTVLKPLVRHTALLVPKSNLVATVGTNDVEESTPVEIHRNMHCFYI